MNRFAGIFLLGWASLVTAADWPQFRGPTADGHYTGPALPTEWGTDKNVAWVLPIPGKAWSSPVVAKGKVYLTTAVPDGSGGQSLRALAVDVEKGNLLWNEEVFKLEAGKAPGIHSKNSHASPTPIVEDERLYVHFGHGGTAALSLEGKTIWKREKLYTKPVHGSGGSPVLTNGLLIFSIDAIDKQAVVALNAKTGETAWEKAREANPSKSFSFSTPTVTGSNDAFQVISVGSDIVMSLDPKTGKELWRTPMKGYSVIPKPLIGKGFVYFSTSYDTPQLIALNLDEKGKTAWSVKKGAPSTPSPLMVGDELYMVSDAGILTCLDAKSGEVIWSERVRGQYSASPIYADGKIYLTNEQGIGTVVQASKTFEKLGEYDLKEKTFASFAAVDGSLFIRTETKLYKFRAK